MNGKCLSVKRCTFSILYINMLFVESTLYYRLLLTGIYITKGSWPLAWAKLRHLWMMSTGNFGTGGREAIGITCFLTK